MQRAFQRSLIVHFPGHGTDENENPGRLLRLLLTPMGYAAPDVLWVHDVSLDRGDNNIFMDR